jgi:hypothetical protein
MWSLLKESVGEIALRWRDVCRIFWLTLALMPLIWIVTSITQYWRISVFEQVDGYIASKFVPVAFLAFLVIVFGLGFAPAAVRWHRTLIADEIASAKLRLPDRKSWAYMLKLSIFSAAFFFVNVFAMSAWSDLIIPIIYMFEYNAVDGSFVKTVLAFMIEPQQQIPAYAVIAISKIIVTAAYVLIFARWFLSLPEKSLDTNFQGATKSWQPFAYRKFLGALILVQSVPYILEAAEKYTSDHLYDLRSFDALWLSMLTIVVNLFIALLGLTLLSVAYRRNLNTVSAGKFPN